ncbi:T9SS type B sorting domain-containing protein [bacterium]|nr:T9SS type B sorting domain-containing protein [bacterium]
MKSLLFFLLFLLSAALVRAQFSMNKSAKKIGDSTYMLTPKAAGNVGSVWDSTLADLSKPFDISFDLKFGCNDKGGKGIAFVLQNDFGGLGEIALDPNDMGYQNEINNSIAIEFDTENDGPKDATYDHIAIHKDGDQGNILFGPTGIYNDKRNVEDCGWHRIRISWLPSITTFNVYVNCEQRVSFKYDVVSKVFNGKKEVFMGFTASNGTGGNGQYVRFWGNSPSRDLSIDLAAQCPDTLLLRNKSAYYEFSNYKWVIKSSGTRLDSIYKRNAVYKAPAAGSYTIQLLALRHCDSTMVQVVDKIDAISGIKVNLNFEIDTTCSEYKININTGCDNCSDLRWHFGQQKVTWAWPYQLLNLSRKTNVDDYFVAQVRQGSCRASDSIYFNMQILSESAPSFVLSADTLCAGEQLQITDPTKGADSLIYTFSSGFGLTKQMGNNIAVKPAGAGTMSIYRRIVYSKYGCQYSDSQKLQIDTLPTAAFTIDSTKSCGEVIYTSTNSSAHATDYTWTGSAGRLKTKEITLKANDKLPKKLRLVAANGGCRDTATWYAKPQLVYKPKSSLSVDTNTGCSPLTVRFTWQTDAVDSVLIDLGNGKTKTPGSNNYSFEKTYHSGTFNVGYTTYSGNGTCVVSNHPVTIEVYDSVVARLAFEQMAGCAPFTMHISDSSYLGNANATNYYVGVGTTETPRLKQIYFLNDEDTILGNEGLYHVRYAVNNSFCSDTADYSIEVRSLGKGDTVDLYGATVDTSQQIVLNWKPIPVAVAYDITRIDDAGSKRIFTAITDSVFVDKWVNPAKNTYTYTVQAMDACGARSVESLPGSNVLLTGLVAETQDAELHWTDYMTFEKGTYTYLLENINGKSYNTSGNIYYDNEFFDINHPDTGKCYRVHAVENGGDKFVSTSNILCLSPVPLVYFPNSFSPNGDGHNDTFGWNGVGIKYYQLQVFDRWGTLVYSGNDKWDGHFNNTPVADGMYFYVCTMKGANRQNYTYTGQLYLMK